MGAAISLHGAVSVLGGFPALTGVDLEVSHGELVFLQGPNGAGKTTLLRLCAGLAPLTAGEGRVLGLDLSSRGAALRRNVVLVGPQSFLFGELTVAENLEFWKRAMRMADEDLRRAAVPLGLERIPLRARVDKLSTGQRRRVELTLVVARRAPLWLLDEPHAGLDVEGRGVLDELVGRAVDSGATVVVASHDADRGGGLRGRVVRMEGGAVVGDTCDGAASAESVAPSTPRGEW
ncbi:MAG: ABC transporter ATP-binding protein [Acidimicrobiales bacterium]|nr:MAG: ABC transporter ATP-binding protein [Acidimicrobiales bacterium]